MDVLKTVKNVNWLRILLFYSIVLTGTYFARKLPNLLNLVLEKITDIPFSFNYNHGLVTLFVSLLFYRLGKEKQQISLLGEHKIKSLLFPFILFACYGVFGISNPHGVNPHLWALIFCFFAFIYNIMEEYAWRGYLIESMSRIPFIVKSLISGILWAVWHLLIFENFDQYGGFWIFLAFCIIFSFILTFAVQRTKSILVAAAIHAFIIQTNIAAVLCFIFFVLLLIFWNKKRIKPATVTDPDQ